MLNSPMFYQECAPASEISHLILSFWEFKVDDDISSPLVHEVFPEGCISLIYKRNKNKETQGLFIHGIALKIFKTDVFPGDTYWGLRFMPSSCAEVLGMDPAQIQSGALDEAGDFQHLTGGLLEKLAVCSDFSEAVVAFETKIKSLEFKLKALDQKITEAVKIIEENRGEIKIFELAERINLSVRQLQRRFRKSSGLSPKQYVRARRIRATAVNLVIENKLNWATRAAEMGFTDQAHLTHEFLTLTGRTPNSFAKKVKHIEHGEFKI